MKNLLISYPPLFALVILIAACLFSATLIAILLPVLRRCTIAVPTATTLHSVPTPQGGGLAVVAAAVCLCMVALNMFGVQPSLETLVLDSGALILAAIGLWDDIRPIRPRLMLVLQAIVAAGVFLLPSDIRLFPGMNLVLERLLTLAALLWSINAVNFLDGIDWMSVATVIPIALTLTIIGSVLAELPWETTVTTAALCGALLGFSPFNKPVARLFLGDAGSLPIGLLLGWCLLQLAANGQLTAALLLPMYPVADTAITLSRRLLHGQSIWRQHRDHFYQRATIAGHQVVRDVFLLNLLLSVLAIITVVDSSPPVGLTAFILGALATGFLLWRMERRASQRL